MPNPACRNLAVYSEPGFLSDHFSSGDPFDDPFGNPFGDPCAKLIAFSLPARLPIRAWFLFLVISALGLSGCQAGDEDQPTTPQAIQASIQESIAMNASPGRIAARVNDDVITLAQVDSAIRLPLYDLERAQFDLRAIELRKLLQQRAKTAAVEVFLNPPLPPRIELPSSSIGSDGPTDAPVVMALFCSFQSIHCVRQQEIWAQLRHQYGDLLFWQAYDYPLTVHRFGRPAANAARCAGAQGAYWPYARSLFNFYDDLTDSRYLTLARQLGLNNDEFSQCLSDQPFKPEVETDIATGEQLGLANVPVVFINGLYISGPQPLAEYQRWIDWELTRLGIKRAQKADIVEPEVALAGEEATPASDTPPLPVEKDEQPELTPQGRPIMPPTGTIELSREWLQAQLQNQEVLAESFESAEHEVEGYKLMRLENVGESEFYQVLGLQDHDVLLRVGDEWLHEGQNPLWDSLTALTEETGELSLVYVRNGLPQHVKVAVH